MSEIGPRVQPLTRDAVTKGNSNSFLYLRLDGLTNLIHKQWPLSRSMKSSLERMRDNFKVLKSVYRGCFIIIISKTDCVHY